jgi:hypothetical protein
MRACYSACSHTFTVCSITFFLNSRDHRATFAKKIGLQQEIFECRSQVAVASEENFSLTLATNCIFEDNWISIASLMWWIPDLNIFFLDQRSFTNWWTNLTDFGIRFALLHLLELQEFEHWNFSFDILKVLMKSIMLKNSELPGSLRERTHLWRRWNRDIEENYVD